MDHLKCGTVSEVFTSQSKHKWHLVAQVICYKLPVFGTEEALVEPMLLALDTTVPFPAVSPKKPTEEDSCHQRSFTARPEID